MIVRATPPRYPRRGPSCLLVLFVMFGVAVAFFVIANVEQVRETIIPTAIPTPTRSATEYAMLADLSEKNKEFDRAIEYYETAVRLDATKPEFYIRLINLLVAQKQAERAIEVAEQVTILSPDNDRVWTAVAAAYLANGERLNDMGDRTGANLQFAQASQSAREAININPENATAYAYAAGGLVLQGDPQKYEQALEFADYAVLLEPNNPWARYYMATVFVYFGNYRAAIEQFQLGIEANGVLPELYYGLAYNYYALASIPNAILAFERAIDIDPNNAAAYDGLAHMYLQLGENPLAEENALKSVELNPNVARARGRLGEAYYNQNNYPEAIQQLTIATTMYGQANELNGRFFYFLAQAYLRSGPEQYCSEATPLFEQVVAAAPAWEPFARDGLEECRLATLGISP